MIAHLLKLVWSRKRANGLIMAEIFFSFLIVFAVTTMAISIAWRWNAPLGFDWRDVWVMSVNPLVEGEHSGMMTGPPPNHEAQLQKDSAQIQRLIDELKSFPEVEAVAADAMPAYANRQWGTFPNVNGRHVEVSADQATDDFARVMRLPVLKGRWFTREDEAQSYLPMVLDADAAEAMFGSVEKAVGQKFTDDHFGIDNSKKELRIVGVIAPYRQDGEFAGKTKMVFFRASVNRPWDPFPSQIAIRVRPGTPASFEAELNRRLHPDSADATFRIMTMERMRTTSIRMRLSPLIALGVVALFLISMVALGLTGVLWQAVTRRMREIGLRRAVGASGSAVRRQVWMEVVLLSTVAVAFGVVLLLQLPLLGFLRVVSPTEFAMGLGAALALIYSITFLCGAYPSWLASTVDPAEALRYE